MSFCGSEPLSRNPKTPVDLTKNGYRPTMGWGVTRDGCHQRQKLILSILNHKQ